MPSYPVRCRNRIGQTQGSSYLLSDAEKNNRYACIKCSYCKRQRYYAIADLRTAFGDVECDDVVHVAGCVHVGCDGKGSLELKLGGPPGDMADVAIQRRIERIFYIRRIVWKDKRGVKTCQAYISARTPSARIDKELPHHICCMENFTIIAEFCRRYSYRVETKKVTAIWPNGTSVSLRLHCFADRSDAAVFAAHFEASSSIRPPTTAANADTAAHGAGQTMGLQEQGTAPHAQVLPQNPMIFLRVWNHRF